jgi:hypothetical protein
VTVQRPKPRQQGVWPIDALGLSICIAATLTFYLLCVAPLARQRQGRARRMSELQDRRQAMAALRADLTRTRERLAVAQEESKAASIRLDPPTEINKRIARLTEFFSALDLTVDDFQTGAPSAGPECSVVPINVVGRGHFIGAARFLRGLNETFPDMSVVRIDLQGTPGQSTSVRRFQFDLFWYAAPTADDPRPQAG